MDQFEVQNFKGKKDRTARLLRLQILMWQHRNGIKISRLAQICSVSVRTIYRDLKTLESELKVPIWEEGAKRGVSEGYFLPPISFSIEEATIIFLSARMLQNYFQNYNLDLV